MARIFLDPRNDIVFKRIFGEHPRILRSFLNALLPLKEGEKIVKLSYLPPEQVPNLPLFKNSIVDVKCVDQKGRQFIVEMQMNWTDAFLNRVLFNASKAYVRQLEKGEEYHLLKPVMALSLLDDTYAPDSKAYYHHYKMVNVDEPKLVIDGLQLIFVELPKFSPKRERHNLMKRTWLRFMSEIGDVKDQKAADKLSADLGSHSTEVKQAIKLTREAAFTPAQLEAYDQYWDAVSRERTLVTAAAREAKEEGMAEGIAVGKAEGLQVGRAEGRAEGKAERDEELTARLKSKGYTEAQIKELLDC